MAGMASAILLHPVGELFSALAWGGPGVDPLICVSYARRLTPLQYVLPSTPRVPA